MISDSTICTSASSDILIQHQISLKAPDRYLKACPIKYDCRNLYICLVELDYCKDTNDIQIILQYPEKLDSKRTNYPNDVDFINNIKKFAFPFIKSMLNDTSDQVKPNSSLVQFYTFVFTDMNRIRQYGYCRSTQNGQRIICLVSHLPWYNVHMTILNKTATIINEKETSVLYNFLEALYEYQLPDPSETAKIVSHDGLERNLLKFFAFFDLSNLIKIFTALLLERHILIVSRSIENLSSCALSLEYLIYPLEWFHAFAPILPEHIDMHIFHQPFPYIYGIHTSIYKKLNASQLNETVVLMVDEHTVVNFDDCLPKSIAHDIHKKLKYFNNPQVDNMSRNLNKYDLLLKTGPIQAFQDAVISVIGDYRQYVTVLDEKNKTYKVNDELYYQIHDVSQSQSNQAKYDFYHEFRNTQAFEEFIRDRGDYMYLNNVKKQIYGKDYIDALYEEAFSSETSNMSFTKIRKKLDIFRKQAKDKQVIKKIINPIISSYANATTSVTATSDTVSNGSIGSSADEMNTPYSLFNKTAAILRLKLRRSSSLSVKSFKKTKSHNKVKPVNSQTNSIECLKLPQETTTTITNQPVKAENKDERLISLSFSSSQSLSTSSSSSSLSSYSNNNVLQEVAAQKIMASEPLMDLNINLSEDPDIKKFLKPVDEPIVISRGVGAAASNEAQLVDLLLFETKNPYDGLDKAKSSISNETTTTTPLNPSVTKLKNFYQSIIDDFDPIMNTNSSEQPMMQQPVQQETTQHQQLKSNVNSLFLPKPFQQQAQQKPFQPMSQSQIQQPFNIQQQPINSSQFNHSLTTSSYNNKQINPFAATPFYGFNHQVMHHSVTYPFSTVALNNTPANSESNNTATNSNLNLFDPK